MDGMSTTLSFLPVEFADLESLVVKWALPTERERRHGCAASSMREISDYYERVGPRIDAIAEYLDSFPMGTLPPPQARLLMLAQSYMEAAVCIEFIGKPDMGADQISSERWHIRDV
jgi:hypothetical protein